MMDGAQASAASKIDQFCLGGLADVARVEFVHPQTLIRVIAQKHLDPPIQRHGVGCLAHDDASRRQ
jgi:hypothetical protein